ncbi:hypoxanthine phosphoribosyltransferase [Verrucomicrobium sp. GAS474]|uniref:phosphoribosyltransferase n=1 Tax=Verrucomicrobium sp. GAS474 TaxID=1882831 RepID=UPI00087B9FA4|nr:phosphoribosyltransferase family protein [Verrucomicrobium sp. GAS474]SDU07828.1 hypoxanthine phosphoribosyltransferase [Verrucomicrobium sp. GAS474]
MKKPSPLGKTLLSSAVLQKRVAALADAITSHYRGKPLVIVALLNGSLFFLVDLLRRLPPETGVECWRVSSYEGTASKGKLHGLDQCKGDFRRKQVLLLDDILDTGLTLHAVSAHLRKLGAEQIEICVLLNKKRKRTVAIRPKWSGFGIGNEFVVGYGLDYNGQYRSLKSIRLFKP